MQYIPSRWAEDRAREKSNFIREIIDFAFMLAIAYVVMKASLFAGNLFLGLN